MDDTIAADDVADSLSALANPLRVRILLTLADTWEPDWTQSGRSYADLRDALGIEDGGRLNYHLDELRDQFLTSEDGHYRLTSAGTRIVGEMFAGTLTGQRDPLEGDIEYDCFECDRSLTARVDGGILSVTCPEHGEVYDMGLPFTLVERHTLTELYELAHQRAWRYVGAVRSDVCPHCANRFAGPDPDHIDAESGSDILLEFACQGCGVAFKLPVSTMAMHCLPTIVFFADHGFDVRTASLFHAQEDWGQTTYETESRFVVQFEMNDERLELELNRALDVVDYERTTSH